MIKGLEEIRYNFEGQKKKYLEITKNLSLEQKQELLNEILEKDLWSYFQFVVDVLYEIASDNNDYIELLEKIYLKIKNDMGSSPFFNMFVDLGQNKKDIGIKIYNKIQGENNNEGLKDISGLILGGYSINDNTILDKLIEDKKLSYPFTNTLIKAIMVKSERFFEEDNKYDLLKKDYEFLDFVLQSDDEKFLGELTNLCIFLHDINKDYFYKKIKELMSKKKSSINRMVFIRRSKLKLSNEQFFELAELTKDCDEYALSELISAIVLNDNKDYYQEVEKISDLFIYWINKDVEFKIRNFDWALGELAKKNKDFIKYFLEGFQKVKTEKLGYIHIFPRIFEKLASQNIEEAIKQLIGKKIYDEDPKLFYDLVSKIIGVIYKTKDEERKEMLKLFLPLAKKVEEIAEKIDFINDNKTSFSNLVQTENFDGLINYLDGLLRQLRFRKTDFDFDEIDKSLSEFEELNSATKDKVDELKKKQQYTPLFWLGSQQRDKELKKAYLGEINNFLNLSKDVSNEKYKDNKTSLSKSLGDESSFWDTFSEIIFTNKFLLTKEKYSLIIEPTIPNKEKNADLSIELAKKKVFFEIKNSTGDRSLHLDNGAVIIKNKLDGIIKDKSSQLFDEKTFKEMGTGKINDLFFIVVDTSSSIIDEHMIADSFFGTLAIQFYRNNKTWETTGPETIRQDDAIVKEKKIITGLIYFKRQLVNIDGEIKFVFIGDIIQNPYAVNKATEKEIEELKKIIFS